VLVTRVGVGFVVSFTLIGLSLIILVADVSRTVTGVGSMSNMPGGIGTTSSSSSLSSLSLENQGNFTIGSILVGMSLVVLATNLSSTVAGTGSVSNMSGGIGTTSSSSSGALLGCFGCFLVIFLAVKLGTV